MNFDERNIVTRSNKKISLQRFQYVIIKKKKKKRKQKEFYKKEKDSTKNVKEEERKGEEKTLLHDYREHILPDGKVEGRVYPS